MKEVHLLYVAVFVSVCNCRIVCAALCVCMQATGGRAGAPSGSLW